MKNDYLLAALEPFAKFADAWDANPIKGISTDPLYSIHSGDKQGVINLRDCYTARDAIAKAKAGLTAGPTVK